MKHMQAIILLCPTMTPTTKSRLLTLAQLSMTLQLPLVYLDEPHLHTPAVKRAPQKHGVSVKHQIQIFEDTLPGKSNLLAQS
jgi:hypothetical protein